MGERLRASERGALQHRALAPGRRREAAPFLAGARLLECERDSWSVCATLGVWARGRDSWEHRSDCIHGGTADWRRICGGGAELRRRRAPSQSPAAPPGPARAPGGRAPSQTPAAPPAPARAPGGGRGRGEEQEEEEEEEKGDGGGEGEG
eukprot:1359864-Rhodomonas_salina.1